MYVEALLFVGINAFFKICLICSNYAAAILINFAIVIIGYAIMFFLIKYNYEYK